MKRLKYLASVVPGQSPDSKDVRELAGGLPFVQGNAEFGTRHPSPRYECSLPPKTASSGDILISVRAPVGALNVADQPYGIGRGLAAVHPVRIDGSYAWWWLHAQKQQLEAEGTGSTFSAVAASDISNLVVPIEDPTWQSRISKFLDRETAQIDELIAKQERLIELLAQKRQAIVTQAITKGLDPSAPTKPSGIPWLSQVNTGWAVRPLSAAGSISLGKMIQPAAKTVTDVRALYLRAANVQPNGILALDDVKKMWFNDRELQLLDLRRGDVVVVEGGIGGFGRAAYVKDDLPGFGYQNSINRIRPFPSVDGRFITYLLLAARHSGFIHAYCTGVSMPHLTAEKLAALRIPLPDKNSQSSIADYLDDKLSKLTLLSEKAASVISMLSERRSALISAAVTGKIDVREGAV